MELKDVGHKVYADSTLRMMKKEDLIAIIRSLEHNWLEAEERCQRQYVILDWCINKGVVLGTLEDINTEIMKLNNQGQVTKEEAEKEFKRVSLQALQDYATVKLCKRIVTDLMKGKTKNGE